MAKDVRENQVAKLCVQFLSDELMIWMDANQKKKFSLHYQTLEENAKRRYREKLTMLGDIKDPYLVINATASSCGPGLDWQHWPDVEYSTIL